MSYPFLPRRRALRHVAAGALVLGAGLAQAGSGTWTSSGPYGGFVSAIAIDEAAPNTLWGVGQGGVFRSYNSGASWQRIEVGLPDALGALDIAADPSGTVLYLSTMQRVYRSGNAGDLWVPTAIPAGLGTSNVYDLALLHGSTTTIAIAAQGKAFVSTNGGSSWGASGSGLLPNLTYNSVALASASTLYLAVLDDYDSLYGGAQVLKSTDGGASWGVTATAASLFGAQFVRVAPTDPLRLYATDGGAVVTSPDGGATWSDVNINVACSGVTSLDVSPTSATTLFVGCRNEGLVFSANATAGSPSWTSTGAAAGLSANGTDAAQLVAVAPSPNFASSGIAYAAAQYGGLFYTANSGTSWSEINNGFQSTDIRSVATHPYDANVVLAGAADSFTTAKTIYRSTDSGATWPASLSGLNAEQIRAIKIDPTTVDNNPATTEPFTVYAAGRSERLPNSAAKDGGIYKSTDGGQHWSTIDVGIGLYPPTGPSSRPDMSTVRGIFLDPRSCAAPPPANALCGIGSGGLNTLVITGGGRPNLSAGGQPYYSARIYKSTDAGAHWTASETGLPLPQDLGPAPASPNMAYGGVVPIVGDPTNAQTLYVGTFMSYDPTVPGEAEPTLENGVFKSTDGGAHWSHASNGLPRIGGPSSSHWDVLSLAINPTAPNTLYASVANLFAVPVQGGVYKTTDGGATWNNVSSGIAGQDVRALYIDPNDPTGDTVYAGSGGTGADPGGVYRSVDGGTTWNSISTGLPADAATALAMPPRAPGAPARVLAGTTAGVWDYTAVPDGDADGAADAQENAVGDGNGDSTPDAQQSNVASMSAPASASLAGAVAAGGVGQITFTVDIVSGCARLNNTQNLQAALYPPDPAGTPTSHDPYGLVSFSMPDCTDAVVTVKYVGASFGPGWVWRNYGPRTPGDDSSFGWYSFSGAKRLDATTWQLTLSANRQGNYRNDTHNILFVGGPGYDPDLIFDNGLE